ncbi:ROK family transcriptional regulator [Catellatospora tritici]|uniref:ROK family transcriptional regulator n=1 Tax=Catellatospora tritici TaxID=2851566 RepID=UPI001C2DC9F3|nr:ROK family transcriptional regulator [Catellatospora tritici]MBV1849364.1 ROK family transcriptional regulator [Catellatospora tritici]
MTRLAGSSKLLRAMNESATLALLLDRGTLTRAELRELTGLSKPTTSDVLRRLTDTGLAVVVGHTSGGPGPNAEVYSVNPVAAYVVALALRDTTESPHPPFGAALCDISGAVLARAEFPGVPGEGPTDTVRRILADLCAAADVPVSRVTRLQLGVPGSYDPGTDTIRHIDIPGWRHPGLVGELAAALRLAVDADNDVNLAAIAERHRGVAQGSAAFALLWFGAGLGCAIDLGAALLRGVTGGAGEIGYLPLGGPDHPVGTPRDMQDLVGGAAVAALAASYGFIADTPEAAIAAAVAQAGPADAEAARTKVIEVAGQSGESEAVIPPIARQLERSTASEAAADAFLCALADRIAVPLAAVSALVDPPLVVLAGEVAQAGGAALRDRVTAAFHRATPLRTPVAVTALSDDAVLLGAMDAGVRAVRESLIDALRYTLTPA